MGKEEKGEKRNEKSQEIVVTYYGGDRIKRDAND